MKNEVENVPTMRRIWNKYLKTSCTLGSELSLCLLPWFPCALVSFSFFPETTLHSHGRIQLSSKVLFTWRYGNNLIFLNPSMSISALIFLPYTFVFYLNLSGLPRAQMESNVYSWSGSKDATTEDHQWSNQEHPSQQWTQELWNNTSDFKDLSNT